MFIHFFFLSNVGFLNKGVIHDIDHYSIHYSWNQQNVQLLKIIMYTVIVYINVLYINTNKISNQEREVVK